MGRARELNAIGDLLASVGGTGGSALQVAGEPGIGKSRLLRELADDARARGYLVCAGRAAEYEGELPFGVFRDALEDVLAGLDPDRRAQLAREIGAELAVVFPALEGLVADALPELQQERYRAVRRLLGTLAADAPVVLVLDDVQWADPGAVELLCHLAAHGVDGAVLLVTGFRPAQLPEPLQGALAAAVREHEALRLDLVPLDAAAATELLGGSVPAGARERLFAQSGGNAFLLLALAEGAARDGWTGGQDGDALLAREADIGLILGMAGLYLAIPLIEVGQARRAREVILETSHGKHEPQTSRSGHATAFEVLTRAEIALGRVDAAEFWARRAEAATHGGRLPAEAPIARRASAVVALARGDSEQAARLALAGARRAADAGVPGEAGRCRIDEAREAVGGPLEVAVELDPRRDSDLPLMKSTRRSCACR